MTAPSSEGKDQMAYKAESVTRIDGIETDHLEVAKHIPIRIEVGGFVVVMPAEKWHALAVAAMPRPSEGKSDLAGLLAEACRIGLAISGHDAPDLRASEDPWRANHEKRLREMEKIAKAASPTPHGGTPRTDALFPIGPLGVPETRLTITQIADEFRQLERKLEHEQREHNVLKAAYYDATEGISAQLSAQSASGAPAWIPVSERLPDDDLTVMISVNGESEPVWMGYYDADHWKETGSGGRVEVTHWMPLPTPPVDSRTDGDNGRTE